jgi:DNA-binding transcriptional MerR regulator
MNAFSIRDIENLCGIKAHTLRIWEQRYKLACPKRKAGNHRTYDNNDLKYLLRIAYLYHSGHKISSIAGLSEDEICDLALSIQHDSDAAGIYMSRLTDACLDLNQEQFDRILHNIILHFGMEKSMLQVIFPFLKKIGLLWLTGHAMPCQEHFATTHIIKKLEVAINGLDKGTEAPQKKVLLFNPVGEFHEIPLLFMQYMLKKNKSVAVYFGSNIAFDALKDYCRQQDATHLYFHLMTNLTKCEPEAYLTKLIDSFPDKEVVASGQQVEKLRLRHARLQVLRSPKDYIGFAAS